MSVIEPTPTVKVSDPVEPKKLQQPVDAKNAAHTYAAAARIASEGSRAADGTTGEYAPEPIEDQVPRTRGTGLAGLPSAPLLSHSEHNAAVREGRLGSVHSWELVTAVDGPGTRFTLFMSGCGLRCQYCHNPDTFKMKDGHAVLLDDVFERIRRYKPVFKATGGGLTLSGGEAMMQPAFVRALMKKAHEDGIHVCLDTCGFLGANLPDEDFENVDLVLLDLKSGDEETYKRVTTRELAPTVRFGDRLAKAGVRTWIRFVLVPGLTDDEQNIRNVAEIAARWPNVERVEVLPFHQMAKDKWATLGLEYKLADTEPPSKEKTQWAREIFRSIGNYEVY